MADPVSLAVGSVLVGGSVIQGQKQLKLQKQALEDQKNAQADAVARAAKAQRDSQTAVNAANQKTPDIGGLLTSEQAAASQGVGSTLLTGPGGIDSKSLKLSKTSLLGA
jgi:hypothetical protein